MTEETRRQKRRQKLARNPKNVRFEDVRQLLEAYGFELKRTKGSHHSFVGSIGSERVTVVIPFRRPLKEIYVKRVLAILDEIEPLDEINERDKDETEDDE